MVELILDSELGRKCLNRSDVTLSMVSVSSDSQPIDESFDCLFAIVTAVIGYETTKDADTTVALETGRQTILIKPSDKRRIAWYSGDTPPYTVSWDYRLPVLGDGKVAVSFAGIVAKCMARVELLIVTKREEGECSR